VTPGAGPVFRAPMRARDRDVPGADFGLEHGVVGTGDVLERPPRTLDDAVAAAARTHGAKAARMLERFAGLPDGTFVWTRGSEGAYHLGRLAGDWRYDDSREAHEVGIHHVRPATWLDRAFAEDEVPPAVAHTFARGGRNLQRINDALAEARTAELWRTG
jgi:hypothetical protein